MVVALPSPALAFIPPTSESSPSRPRAPVLAPVLAAALAVAYDLALTAHTSHLALALVLTVVALAHAPG